MPSFTALASHEVSGDLEEGKPDVQVFNLWYYHGCTGTSCAMCADSVDGVRSDHVSKVATLFLLCVQGSSGQAGVLQRALAFVVKWSRALLAMAAVYAVLLTMLLMLLRRLPTRGALSEKAHLPEVGSPEAHLRLHMYAVLVYFCVAGCAAAQRTKLDVQFRSGVGAEHGTAHEVASQYLRAASRAPHT